jgi:Fe-Mn family superoxide dismutase
MPEQNLENLVKQSIASTFSKKIGTPEKKTLNEGVILTPKTYVLKTESLSGMVKELHTNFYKTCVDSFNDISRKLDVLDPENADNPQNSSYRHLRRDEIKNLNAVKLHELYFSNTADPNSEIRVDSIPFMRLSRDWGTFEKWQFDFRACGMSAKEGWAICYFEPYKQRYMNTFIEGDASNVPMGAIPVLVIDTHHHAWFRDFTEQKVEYLNTMMREINWSVVEARMVVAEKTNLQNLYAIQPVANMEPERMIGMLPTNQPPISKDQVVDKAITNPSQPLSVNGQMPPATPTAPNTIITNPRGV